MQASRAKDWLAQAEDDRAGAGDLVKAGRFALACFISQQAAEKALKAIAFARGADLIKTHSILKIAQALQINGAIADAARRLDQYYIGTRYPDAVAAGAPYEFFTQPQAVEALALADTALQYARGEVK